MRLMLSKHLGGRTNGLPGSWPRWISRLPDAAPNNRHSRVLLLFLLICSLASLSYRLMKKADPTGFAIYMYRMDLAFGSAKPEQMVNGDGDGSAASHLQTMSVPCAATAQLSIRKLLCASLCGLLAACTGNKTLYVAPTGADSNPGTQAAPVLTIAHADQLARPGYTIHVAPGIYSVTAPTPNSAGIKTSQSGTASARIRFVSSVKGAARIVVSGTGIAWHSKGNYVDIEGFDISGSGRHGILASGAHLRITNNFIHDLTISGGCTGGGGAAIDTDGPVGDVLIKGNVVRNVGYAMLGTCNTVQGIYIASPNNTVTDNIVSKVAAVGITQWHGATASTIVNNTVSHSKIGILLGQGDAGTTAIGSRDNYVANNSIYCNKTYGIVEGGKMGENNRYADNQIAYSGTSLSVKGSVSNAASTDHLAVKFKPSSTESAALSSASPVHAHKGDAQPGGASADDGNCKF